MDEGLLDIFREESLERVERMASTLLAAEPEGGDAEAIAQLFRDAHSIKGSAGMFGLDQIGALAGAMEDVLARSRESGVLSPRSIPALLGGADAIRAAVTDELGATAPAAAAALRALDSGRAAASPSPVSAPTPAPADEPRPSVRSSAGARRRSPPCASGPTRSTACWRASARPRCTAGAWSTSPPATPSPTTRCTRSWSAARRWSPTSRKRSSICAPCR